MELHERHALNEARDTPQANYLSLSFYHPSSLHQLHTPFNSIHILPHISHDECNRQQQRWTS